MVAKMLEAENVTKRLLYYACPLNQ